MKRKILVLFIPLFLIPVSGVFAYENNHGWDYKEGILDNSSLIKDINMHEYHYDNDLDTRNNHILANYIEFTYPMNIEGIFVVTSGFGSRRLHVDYFDEENERIQRITYQSSDNGYHELNFKNVLMITFDHTHTGQVNQIEFFGEISSDVVIPIANIMHLRTEHSFNHIELNWQNTIQDEFDYVEILANDEVFTTESETFTLENLTPNTTYEILIKTVDKDGNKSDGMAVEITTDPLPTEEVKEVKNVVAETDVDRVNLSWSLPETEYFEHVTIYRKQIVEETASIFDFLKPMKVHASTEEHSPIFETNGTYFNDLTVESDSTYEYKLTTTYQEVESSGVYVTATTAPAPPPILSGENYEKQENGDYLVSWDQPETGEVRILVDGSEYTTIPASEKQFTIPAGDMKYSSLGSPLVGLQTIGENGQESPPIPGVSNADLPFTVADLITTTNGLFLLIGSFLLLGLSFVFAPKLIKLIRSSFKNNGSIAKAERQQSNYSIREEKAQARSMRQVERAQTIGSGREPRESRISLRQSRQPRQGRA